MTDLHKIGLKMREWHFREVLAPKFPSECGAMSLTLLSSFSSPPPRKLRLWRIFFALPAMNGPLPAELKFRENSALSW